MDKGQKRLIVLSVSIFLLVVIVVAVVIAIVTNKNDDDKPEVSTSSKAIKTLCDSVDYQDTCVKGLSSKEYNQTDDPKTLVQNGFTHAIKHVKLALNKSATLENLEQDPRSKEALKSCTELADTSLRDLERSLDKFSNHDISQLNSILPDLKVWISGAMTSEQTCLDGFQNVTGEAGGKMREALNSGMQMTTNSLGMVSEIATAFAQINNNNNKPPANQRRLLSYPDWLDPGVRTLLQEAPKSFEADVIVAQDGSGKYQTINEALTDIPKSSSKTFMIHIKEGVYAEKVEISSNMTNVLLIGDGPDKTRITGNLNVVDGTTTYKSATVAVHGDNFIAKDIGFENSAGAEKEQAVALRVSADKTIFYNCWMDGYQDTLYTHTYRQFYRDCSISGTIDFVFGDAAVVFQCCSFLVRKPLDNQKCIVTAQGRKNVRQPTGIVLQNCTIIADSSLQPVKSSVETFLGRPWKEYSRTIIMESFIDDLIKPEGYLPWNDTFALNTLFYTEFNNRGPSSSKDKRVKWPGIKELTSERIKRFTAIRFIDGDLWIPRTKVPYASGLIQPPPTNEPAAASPMSQEEDADFNHTQTKAQSDLQSVLKSPPPSPPPSPKSSSQSPPPSGGSASPPPKPAPPGPKPPSGSTSPAAAPTLKDSPAASGPSPASAGPAPSKPKPVPEPDTTFDFGKVFNSQPNASSSASGTASSSAAPVLPTPRTSTSAIPSSNSSSGSLPSKGASPVPSSNSSSGSLASKGASPSSSSGQASKGASSPSSSLPSKGGSSPSSSLPSKGASSPSSSPPSKGASPPSSSSSPNATRGSASSSPNSTTHGSAAASSPSSATSSPKSGSGSGSGSTPPARSASSPKSGPGSAATHAPASSPGKG